ncbi:hypothetical protein [Aliivibrio kagoshimensis]|uniref:hypothetical protein n=1 Tax=Aliivibrio kagoshimensis TaxID=2910230 RepID=UPI003D0DD802
MKQWLTFVLSLLLIESFIGLSLTASYIWVERDLCPTDRYASGHCYADWFSWYEWGFYCLAIILFYSAIVWLTLRVFRPIKNANRHIWLLGVISTMVLFVIGTDFRFMIQAFIATPFIILISLWLSNQRSE